MDRGCWWLLILAAFIIYIVIQTAVDSTRFVVRTYEISSPKITEDKSIVFLSDLHGRVYGKDNKILLEEIDSLHPDAVLIGGDMVTAVNGNSEYEAGLKVTAALNKKYPLIYAMGNHEFKTSIYRDKYGNFYDEYVEALAREGVSFTDNEMVELFPNIKIWGLSLKFICYKRLEPYPLEDDYIKDTLGECDENDFNILLAHNPDYFDKYAAWGADLTLSGHVHGGVVRIPGWKGVISPRWALFPKYDGGEFDIDGKKMILSRGLGMHTIPLRLFNPAEIVYIKLMKEK